LTTYGVRKCTIDSKKKSGIFAIIQVTVFMTVFNDILSKKPHGYWLVTRFNIIARYVERMLSATSLTTA
jgi:hypothetical protein